MPSGQPYPALNSTVASLKSAAFPFPSGSLCRKCFRTWSRCQVAFAPNPSKMPTRLLTDLRDATLHGHFGGAQILANHLAFFHRRELNLEGNALLFEERLQEPKDALLQWLKFQVALLLEVVERLLP